jgi:DNA-directed RNA polymerase subunit delta
MATKQGAINSANNNAAGEVPEHELSSMPTIETFADDEDEIEFDIVAATKKKIAASAGDEDEDEEDNTDTQEEESDDWNKSEEEDNWDPDFDEFDIPKSAGKAGKKGKDDDDDFAVDDEFKDLFSGSSSDFDDEEDDF